MLGLEQYDDPSLQQRWLMGLGARLMMPTRTNFAGLAGKAVLGSMTDLAQLTQEARRNAAMKAEEERLKQRMEMERAAEERRQRARIEAQKAMAKLTGAQQFDTAGTGLGRTLGITPQPGKPLDEAGRYGLGQQLMLSGVANDSPRLSGLGAALMEPAARRKLPNPDGTVSILRREPSTGEWVEEQRVPNYSAIRSTGGIIPELGLPVMRGGGVAMQPLSGQASQQPAPVQQTPQAQPAPPQGDVGSMSILPKPSSPVVERLKAEREQIMMRLDKGYGPQPKKFLGLTFYPDDWPRDTSGWVAPSQDEQRALTERLRKIEELLRVHGAL